MSPQTERRAAIGMMLGLMSIGFYREADPFDRETTNIIAYVAQYAIFVTCEMQSVFISFVVF